MGERGAVLRKLNGFIIWTSDGPALLKNTNKGASRGELKGQFGPAVELTATRFLKSGLFLVSVL